MKNIELMNKLVAIKNVPLTFEGRALPSKLQAKIVLIKVAYEKSVAAFNEKIREASGELKPEGFDELEAKVAKMFAVEAKAKAHEEWNGEGEKPEAPTQEEKDEAAAIREQDLKAYEEQKRDFVSKLNEAYAQELNEEAAVKEKTLTEDELAEIIEVVGADGDMDLTGNDGMKHRVKRCEFIELIASGFCE